MEVPARHAFKVKGLEANIVVDSWVNGLAAGGLRYSPGVTQEHLRRLARTMSRKWTLLDLPFGGCKLGIRGDPESSKKVTVLRAFARTAENVLRDRIVTGPDLGTSFREMGVFFRALGQDGYDVAADRLCARGLHPTPKKRYIRILNELEGESTGLAVARAALEAWSRVQGGSDEITVSIQGFGQVGRVVAREMARQGTRVVCIADAEGALWNPRGLDPQSLGESRPGIVDRTRLPPWTEEAPRETWASRDVDLLVPAAIPDAIHRENVHRVRAKMVVEAANIPIPEDVETQLHRRGVFVVPDFLVNGGLAATFGLLVTREWWRSRSVLSEAIQRIVDATNRVVEAALEQNREPRKVAVELADSPLTPP